MTVTRSYPEIGHSTMSCSVELQLAPNLSTVVKPQSQSPPRFQTQQDPIDPSPLHRSKMHKIQIALVLFLIELAVLTAGFLHDTRLILPSIVSHKDPPRAITRLFASTAPAASVLKAKIDINSKIESTQRGLSTTAEERAAIEKSIRSLETQCPLSEPARDPRMGGGWEVLYTNAPPPSNGKLGPFVGVAKQSIDLEEGRYSNILEVGGDSKWLTAVLNASWKEWDGVLLEDKGGGQKWRDAVVTVDDDDSGEQESTASKGTESPDYGATSWKVDFKTITISLFGFPLVEQQFDEGTSRVWRMSYLDDDTRVVRAGRTGKGEDDVVFYMVRNDNIE